MATIRIRDNGTYQVQIRLKNKPAISRTFKTKKEAKDWAKLEEAKLLSSPSKEKPMGTKFSEVVEHYKNEIVIPKNKTPKSDVSRLNRLDKHFSGMDIEKITSGMVADYRNQRLKEVGSGSVRRELAIISQLFNHAMHEMDVELPNGNPVKKIKRPAQPPHRERRVSSQELAAIIERIPGQENKIFVELLVETAMRRKELGELEWKYVDLDSRIITIMDSTSKTGYRRIPISARAVQLLKSLASFLYQKERVFSMEHESVSQAFVRTCKELKIEDLHLHDLRREATSRLFEKGLNSEQVRTITGHKTLQMLAVYSKLKPEDLVDLL